MCRWMAWLGQPVLIEELLFKTQHGIVDQSLHARMGAEPTNGDGFGLGWYGARRGARRLPQRRRRRGRTPTCASSPRTSSRRCSWPTCAPRSARPVQQTNCHPFRHGRLAVRAQRLHRRLPPAAPRPDARARPRAASPTSQGSTDTEVVFHARAHARARGGPDRGARADDRPASSELARAARDRRRRAGQLRRQRRRDACGRCATRPSGHARSLFVSADVDAIRRAASRQPALAAAQRATTA